MFDIGNNIHPDCNVFNILLLCEIVLILLLFNYKFIILALTSSLDDIYLLRIYIYKCCYIEFVSISISLVNVTIMGLWKIKMMMMMMMKMNTGILSGKSRTNSLNELSKEE